MKADGQVLTLPAYWHKKRKWVSVPLYHIPKDAVTQEGNLMHFRLIPTGGQKIEPMPRRYFQASILIEESIFPLCWSVKELKQLCIRNDIPLSWVTDRFLRKSRYTGDNINRRKERKNPPLTPKEFRRVLKEVKQISPQTALIVQILWLLNKNIGKDGSFIPFVKNKFINSARILPRTKAWSEVASLNKLPRVKAKDRR